MLHRGSIDVAGGIRPSVGVGMRERYITNAQQVEIADQAGTVLDRMAALNARKPCFDDRGNMRSCPLDLTGTAGKEDEDHGLAGGGDGFKKLLLIAGQTEVGAAGGFSP